MLLLPINSRKCDLFACCPFDSLVASSKLTFILLSLFLSFYTTAMSRAYDKPWLVEKAAYLIRIAKAAPKTIDIAKYDRMYAVLLLVTR
jgi:hypothetical protein